jgi:hypothetical protein
MALPTGFEPVIFTVKRCYPGPLDEGSEGATVVIKTVKKAKKATAKTWKRKTVKKRPLTQRELSVAARLDELGLTHEAAEQLREITSEINRKFGDGPKLKLNRMLTEAQFAFEDGILNSNTIKECVAAARKSAGL